jgi:hypothetical protein
MKGLVAFLSVLIGVLGSLNAYSQQSTRIPDDRLKMEVAKQKQDGSVATKEKTMKVAPRSNELDKVQEGVVVPTSSTTKPATLKKEDRFEMEKRRFDSPK